jgi:hypothetical protein
MCFTLKNLFSNKFGNVFHLLARVFKKLITPSICKIKFSPKLSFHFDLDLSHPLLSLIGSHLKSNKGGDRKTDTSLNLVLTQIFSFFFEYPSFLGMVKPIE